MPTRHGSRGGGTDPRWQVDVCKGWDTTNSCNLVVSVSALVQLQLFVQHLVRVTVNTYGITLQDSASWTKSLARADGQYFALE